MSKIKDKIEFSGIVMRNVPNEVRENFKRLALEEFDNHYGLTLRTILLDYFEYQRVKDLFFRGEFNLDSFKDETKDPVGIDGTQIKLRRSK